MIIKLSFRNYNWYLSKNEAATYRTDIDPGDLTTGYRPSTHWVVRTPAGKLIVTLFERQSDM